MSHKSTKIIAVISSLIFLVCIGVLISAFVLVTKQKQAYIEHGKRRAEISVHKATLAELVQSLDATKNERALLSSRILHDEDIIDFLSLIETLGKEQGVNLTTKSLTVEPIDDSFEMLVVELDVVGSYASVMQVLTLLEHIPHQIIIDTAQLEQNGSEEESAWKGTFRIKVTKSKKYETQS